MDLCNSAVFRYFDRWNPRSGTVTATLTEVAAECSIHFRAKTAHQGKWACRRKSPQGFTEKANGSQLPQFGTLDFGGVYGRAFSSLLCLFCFLTSTRGIVQSPFR